ncbi:MAG: DNA glycosylase AlkZ-like family protein [Nereida ignava]
MTTPLRISNTTARYLWLAQNGLGDAPTGPLDVMGIVARLGFVQLDTIQVVARAHHHIMWSRNQNYREHMLDDALAQGGQLFEHFTHDASLLPIETLPIWQRQFRRKKAQWDRAGGREICLTQPYERKLKSGLRTKARSQLTRLIPK